MAARKAIDAEAILAALEGVTAAATGAALQKQSDLVHDFIFQTSDESAAGIDSGRLQQGDRCAFNFNSGGKEIDNHVDGKASAPAVVSKQQQVTTTGRRHISEDQCSRTGYRFGLIEVLSRLHDDGVLLNDRHALSSMQTEVHMAMGSTANNGTQHAHKMCV